MAEKNPIASSTISSAAKKESVKLCNVCGDIRNEAEVIKEPNPRKEHGKEKTYQTT